MIKGRFFNISAVMLLAVMASGCADGNRTLLAPGLQLTGDLKECFEIAGSLGRENTTSDVKAIAGMTLAGATQETSKALDVLLSCAVGPVTKKKPKISDSDTMQTKYEYYGNTLNDISDEAKRNEFRHLRGHAIVALISRYGAFNATGEVGDIVVPLPDLEPDDAADIMSAIHEAEYEIRRSSERFDRATLDAPYQLRDTDFENVNRRYQLFHRIRRVGAVAELAAEAATPTGRRTLGFARALVSVVATPTAGGIADLYARAKAGIEKLAILNQLAPAYLADTNTILQARFDAVVAGGKVTRAHWEQWDAHIHDSCKRLAKTAGVNMDCTPGDYSGS